MDAAPRGARIKGLGHHLPDRVVTNHDLAELLDTTDAWIVQRTGIEERRWVTGDVGASELAEPAARAAMDRAGITADQLDLIVFATLSPDVYFPGSACLLQARLGCPGVAALDVRNQCTGFVYGLAVADHFIRSGMMSRVLVVGAEVHSTGLDMSPAGRDVTVLFGDGAGAAVVEATEGPERVLGHRLHADGQHAELLWVPAPQSRTMPRIDQQMLDAGLHYPHMQGRAVFKHAVERLPEVVLGVLEDHGLGLDDLDLLVPHQANLRINELAGRRLGLPEHKVVHNIQRYGNTTAGSIPIALSEAVADGRVKPGSLVCLAAFGAGLTWGASLMRWA